MSSVRTVKGNSRKLTLVLAGFALAGLALGQLATDSGIPAAHTRSSPPGIAVLAATAPVPAAANKAAPITLARAGTRVPLRRGHRAPRLIARAMLPGFHWGRRQFRYLDWLWAHESGWNRYAANPYSGAYGIPQAVPGSKMATAGPGWRWNARTQIRWGMDYIRARYGSPRAAWLHECWYGWY